MNSPSVKVKDASPRLQATVVEINMYPYMECANQIDGLSANQRSDSSNLSTEYRKDIAIKYARILSRKSNY